MRQIFTDKKIDASLFLRMENLMYALLKSKDAFLEYGYQAYYDELENKVVISRFWDDRHPNDKAIGLKSEVYLKALGYKHFADMNLIRSYSLELQASPLRSFLTQLFVLLEDLRTEELIKKERPGTASIFKRRRTLYRNHFTSQFEINRIRNFQSDMLFCLCYLALTSDKYESYANEYFEQIELILHDAFHATNTEETMYVVEKIRYRLEEVLHSDMINHYFGLAPLNSDAAEAKKEEKAKELANCDIQQLNDNEKKNKEEESFSTWHRENKNNDNENFLRFELESGTKTNLMGHAARESEDQDQAMASVQGQSKQSSQSNFGTETLDAIATSNAEGTPYGKFNVGAVHRFKEARKPSPGEKAEYQVIKSLVNKDVKELKKTIEKTIENKTNATSEKFYGRLGKKLLRIYTEKQPRLFYKKGQESKELDVTFHLLIDCSGSMFNKMEETKKSVVLFHEALKSLKIPHAISGFWEDASNAKKEHKPNIIHEVITHRHSITPGIGPEIMQLREEEDNRDGYIIRIISDLLVKRREKHKFLLVFTDGEPSALDYNQDGILDTHEAVKLARKKGLEVIGIFIEEGEAKEETYALMKNIYNHHFLVANHAEDLRHKIKPLLKKLLLKTIQ
ncbi:VWA domain-containing protein [Ectobacillus antri]|jgi:nitric oxide reductase activation protein|uniref:VWA domain-containing protein n=1 Tax=Ectobacillus antri TaxID=2486280 RepID=A0ABT6H5X7_9BACI|nr:VWA domain-containing protein [Ectobacillus antri]MDG4657404.1 VWA domain-containing protein [Ectobacillus antri]MDG5754465.1 VWA domain-containing protein [Ectobacillus antri]